MSGRSIDELRDAMLAEALSEVIALSEAVKKLDSTLKEAVPNARAQIEKGGELAVLRFREVADDRIAQMNRAMQDISALRELLVGEVAVRVRVQGDQQLRDIATDLIGMGSRRRRFELMVCAAAGSVLTLALVGVGTLVLHTVFH
jgi:hypothetical protein